MPIYCRLLLLSTTFSTSHECKLSFHFFSSDFSLLDASIQTRSTRSLSDNLSVPEWHLVRIREQIEVNFKSRFHACFSQIHGLWADISSASPVTRPAARDWSEARCHLAREGTSVCCEQLCRRRPPSSPRSGNKRHRRPDVCDLGINTNSLWLKRSFSFRCLVTEEPSDMSAFMLCVYSKQHNTHFYTTDHDNQELTLL